MFYRISKAHKTVASFTNDKGIDSQFLVIPIQIRAQTLSTENPSPDTYMIHGGPATWTAYKQTTVVHSSTDAEYMTLSDASREAIARIQFFEELNLPSAPILILADSQVAIDIADGSAVNHTKTKHIDIRYHALRHYIQEDKVLVNHIPGSDNIADLFTKALPRSTHECLVDCMGMRNIEEILE
jgi:hypothetical protein